MSLSELNSRLIIMLLLSLPNINPMVINKIIAWWPLDIAFVLGNCYHLTQFAGRFTRWNSDAFQKQKLCCYEMLLCPLAPVSVRPEYQADLTGTRRSKEIDIHLYLSINNRKIICKLPLLRSREDGETQTHLKSEIKISQKSHTLVLKSSFILVCFLACSSPFLAFDLMNLLQYSLLYFHSFSHNFKTKM